MAEESIIADPGTIRALLDGSRTQSRHLATSRLAACRAGDRLWVRESCVLGRIPPGRTQEMATAMRHAEFAVFSDGWRHHRNGGGWKGDPPIGKALEWTPAVHMPRWASRATLAIDSVAIERLHGITRAGIRAEGLQPLLGGMLWRWPKPVPGLWRDPARAYAARWNIDRAAGERWDDDPEIVVLGFRVKRHAPNTG